MHTGCPNHLLVRPPVCDALQDIGEMGEWLLEAHSSPYASSFFLVRAPPLSGPLDRDTLQDVGVVERQQQGDGVRQGGAMVAALGGGTVHGNNLRMEGLEGNREDLGWRARMDQGGE